MTETRLLDDLDRRILRHLQADPSRPAADLAEAAGTTPAVLSRRLARMTETAVLKGQEAVIDWRALGFSVEVSLRVTLDKTNPRAFDEFIAAAREVPEVLLGGDHAAIERWRHGRMVERTRERRPDLMERPLGGIPRPMSQPVDGGLAQDAQG